MNLEEQPTRDLNILDVDYGRAALEAGGIPVPVLGIEASVPNLIRRLDGFVFTGGDDIHPKFYSEKLLPGVKTTLSADARTRFELKLFKAAVRAKKPILGICLGTQLINVALGGSLVQDIPAQVPAAIQHGPLKRGEKVFHPVAVFEGTALADIIGARSIRVRSSHHQAVKHIGRGLTLSATARDGVIEALEGRNRNFLIAVQWHPEKTPRDRYTKRLFKALVNASRR